MASDELTNIARLPYLHVHRFGNDGLVREWARRELVIVEFVLGRDEMVDPGPNVLLDLLVDRFEFSHGSDCFQPFGELYNCVAL